MVFTHWKEKNIKHCTLHCNTLHVVTHDTTGDIDAKRNAAPSVVLLRQSAAGAIAPQVNLWDHWNLRYTLYTVYISIIHKYYVYIYMCMCICILLCTYASASIYIHSYIYIYVVLPQMSTVFVSHLALWHCMVVPYVIFWSPSVRRRIKTATVPKRNIAPEPPTPERSFGVVLKFTIPFNHHVSWLRKSH